MPDDAGRKSLFCAPSDRSGDPEFVLPGKSGRSCYAKEALRLLCDYVFSFLYLKQLIVHISVDNEASIRLFESCGFVRCGLLREWWRVGGCYKDVVLLQLLRNTN